MSQELPVYITQATPPPPSKEKVYPEPVLTVTPSKPHSYDDDTSAPMKPQAYEESPEPGPPSYPVMKPNAPDTNTTGYNLQDKPLPGSSVPGLAVEKRSLIQAKNSTRTPPMQYNPAVGSNISQFNEEEESKGAFFESMQRKLSTTKSTRDPLNNPPDCFERPAQFSAPPQPFPTFYLRSLGKHVDKGFPKAFPGSQLGSHDIYAEEWTQFLDDLAYMGKLSGVQKGVSTVFPVTRYVGFIGHTITKKIENGMKKGKHGKIASLVDIWNAVFFNQRGVNVVLLHGSTRVSGPPVEEDPVFYTTPASPPYGSTPQMMNEYPPYSPVPQYNEQQFYQSGLDRGNSLSSTHSSQSSQSTRQSMVSQQKSPVYNDAYGHNSSPEGSQQSSEPSPTSQTNAQLQPMQPPGQTSPQYGQAQPPAPYGQSQPPAPYGQSQPPAPYGQSQPPQHHGQPYAMTSPGHSPLQNMSSPFGLNQALSLRHSRHQNHRWSHSEKKQEEKRKENYYLMVEYQPMGAMSPTAMAPPMAPPM
ncbi:unnamed protein product [Umbelopsis ramanniana]